MLMFTEFTVKVGCFTGKKQIQVLLDYIGVVFVSEGGRVLFGWQMLYFFDWQMLYFLDDENKHQIARY